MLRRKYTRNSEKKEKKIKKTHTHANIRWREYKTKQNPKIMNYESGLRSKKKNPNTHIHNNYNSNSPVIRI